MRTVKALIAVTFVLAAACSSAVPVGQIPTTGAQCLAVESACHMDSECCTMWCVNGACDRREP
jgi:hypothetical protein